MKPETWVAIYAAIVGTGALLLNFRSWFERRVRLHLSLMDNARLNRDISDRELLAVTVTNRGGSPTTITHMFIIEYPSLWRRLRNRPADNYFIPTPGPLGSIYTIPYELAPAKLWTGIADKTSTPIPKLHDGRHYVAIFCSNRNRPYVARIPKNFTKLPEHSTTI
jgi:hypothetical protein